MRSGAAAKAIEIIAGTDCRGSQILQALIPQREDFTDRQSGHCRKNDDRAEKSITRSYESSNFFCRKKL